MNSLYTTPQITTTEEIVTVGFNTLLGHFAQTETGRRVAIGRAAYIGLIEAADRQAEIAARADAYGMPDLCDDTLADYIEYQANGYVNA